MRFVVTGLTAALLTTLALSGNALAQRAAAEAELRAGPGDNFPSVVRVARDESLQVHGCVEGYAWCDVNWQKSRGWIPADQLAYQFDEREVRASEYGPRLKLPVVGFAFSAYWDAFYSSEPWYQQRDDWQNMWRDQPEYLRYGRAERPDAPGGSLATAGSAKAITRDRAQRDSFGERAESQGRDAVERSAGAGVESRSNAEAGRGDASGTGPDGGPDASGVNQPSGGGQISGSVRGTPMTTTPGNAAGSSPTGSTLSGPTPGNPVSGSSAGGAGSSSLSGSGSVGGASSGAASGGSSGGGGGGGSGGGGGGG